jgi:serine/threonine protein phosphatase 1
MDYDKIFVIGDIHGCLEMLNNLVNKIPWRHDRDLLIFLGDYIDRGQKSKEVVDYIIALKRYSQYVKCLLGNHDAMFLNYLYNKKPNEYILNGGGSTLKNYGIENPGTGDSQVPPDHIDFFNSLKSYIELDDYYVVHAGFRPGIEISEQKLEDMLWIRETFIASYYDFGKKVIFGHTPFREPLVMENKIGLDTSAVFGNRLTCLELPEERFYSVAQ